MVWWAEGGAEARRLPYRGERLANGTEDGGNRALDILVARRGTVRQREVSDKLKVATGAEGGESIAVRRYKSRNEATHPFPNPLVNLKLYSFRLMTRNSLRRLFKSPSKPVSARTSPNELQQQRQSSQYSPSSPSANHSTTSHQT